MLITIVKIYIDRLIMWLERVGHATLFFYIKAQYECVILYQYGWALEFP